MCAVSFVIDAARTQFPPIDVWPKSQAEDMLKVIDMLKKIDDKLGAKDCVDATKDAFVKELERRIIQLEGKVLKGKVLK